MGDCFAKWHKRSALWTVQHELWLFSSQKGPLPPRFLPFTVSQMSLWSALSLGVYAEIRMKVCSFGQIYVMRAGLGVRRKLSGLVFGA